MAAGAVSRPAPGTAPEGHALRRLDAAYGTRVLGRGQYESTRALPARRSRSQVVRTGVQGKPWSLGPHSHGDPARPGDCVELLLSGQQISIPRQVPGLSARESEVGTAACAHIDM